MMLNCQCNLLFGLISCPFFTAYDFHPYAQCVHAFRWSGHCKYGRCLVYLNLRSTTVSYWWFQTAIKLNHSLQCKSIDDLCLFSFINTFTLHTPVLHLSLPPLSLPLDCCLEMSLSLPNVIQCFVFFRVFVLDSILISS